MVKRTEGGRTSVFVFDRMRVVARFLATAVVGQLARGFRCLAFSWEKIRSR
jgi:hypothetical protein